MTTSLYYHFVAGLGGEDLSKFFSASGKEAAWLGDLLELSNSNVFSCIRRILCGTSRRIVTGEVLAKRDFGRISYSPFAMSAPFSRFAPALGAVGDRVGCIK
jgi:hypothetical protein